MIVVEYRGEEAVVVAAACVEGVTITIDDGVVVLADVFVCGSVVKWTDDIIVRGAPAPLVALFARGDWLWFRHVLLLCLLRSGSSSGVRT